jgi:hypothetical protein
MDAHRGPQAADPDSPAIVVTTASGLVSSVPYLVGFAPTESLVLVFLTGPPRVVAVTLRIDLIPPEHDARLSESLDQLGSALDRARDFDVDLDLVHLLVFSEQAARLPAAAMVSGVEELCRARGVEVFQTLAVHDGRMWRYGCPEVGCHPCAGHSVRDSEAVRAEFDLVTAGVGYAPDRAALERAVRPDPDRRITEASLAAALQECAAANSSVTAGRRWRRGCEDALLAAMNGPYDPAQVLARGAVWGVALRDSRVREPLLYRLLVVGPAARRSEQLSAARDWLSGLVRMLPDSACGPVAATLAALAWQQGDGAYARIAAERALECEPSNRLATLIEAACGSGMPPRHWLQVLTSFSLAELRAPLR